MPSGLGRALVAAKSQGAITLGSRGLRTFPQSILVKEEETGSL